MTNVRTTPSVTVPIIVDFTPRPDCGSVLEQHYNIVRLRFDDKNVKTRKNETKETKQKN